LAQDHQYLDEVIPFYENLRYWNPGYFIWFWRRIRSGYDLAIVLNTVSHSLTSDILARISRARYVLGTEHRLFNGTKRNFFYNLIAPHFNSTRHQSERNLDIVRFLGMNTDDLREHITLSSEERELASARVQSLGWDLQKLLIAIHPGAGKLENRWPVEHFALVGDKLAHDHAAQLLVTWGPKEEALGYQLLSALKHPAIALSGLKLRGLAAVYSHARLLICNDTGVMHLAASVGTPLVAIFGPTDPEQWKPIGDQIVAVRAEDCKCISVTPDQVLDAASRLISRQGVPQ
jgi:ADP-heptose:LPS heptosyltransferase